MDWSVLDKKRDDYLIKQKEGNKFLKTVTDFHISLLMVPGKKFNGQFTPVNSCSSGYLQRV